MRRGFGKEKGKRKMAMKNNIRVVMVPCSSEYLQNRPTKTALSLYV